MSRIETPRPIRGTQDIFGAEAEAFAHVVEVFERVRKLYRFREFTAGIARAYLTAGWQQYAPLKAATHGPLFRYERPQKGRYRQFHQLDAEIIGAAEPQADVELLAMADQLLKELGIAEGVTLQLNTLGDAPSREAWRMALVDHNRDARDALSEDSKERL